MSEDTYPSEKLATSQRKVVIDFNAAVRKRDEGRGEDPIFALDLENDGLDRLMLEHAQQFSEKDYRTYQDLCAVVRSASFAPIEVLFRITNEKKSILEKVCSLNDLSYVFLRTRGLAQPDDTHVEQPVQQLGIIHLDDKARQHFYRRRINPADVLLVENQGLDLLMNRMYAHLAIKDRQSYNELNTIFYQSPNPTPGFYKGVIDEKKSILSKYVGTGLHDLYGPEELTYLFLQTRVENAKQQAHTKHSD